MLLVAATSVARAFAMLLIAFLSLRGAIALWQQFVAAEHPNAPAPGSTQQRGADAALSKPTAPDTSAPTLRPAEARPGSTVAVSWHVVETSASFVEGHAGPVVAAFIDPDCGYCSQLWRRVRAPLAAGRLRMRWIPVAVLAPDGLQRAAALLLAADPVAALAAHEIRSGASPPPMPNIGAMVDAVAANNALLDALTGGRPATPLLVARGAGHVPRLTIGLPADLAAFLDGAR